MTTKPVDFYDEDSIRERVALIAARVHDPEAAHGMEDATYEEFITWKREGVSSKYSKEAQTMRSLELVGQKEVRINSTACRKRSFSVRPPTRHLTAQTTRADKACTTPRTSPVRLGSPCGCPSFSHDHDGEVHRLRALRNQAPAVALLELAFGDLDEIASLKRQQIGRLPLSFRARDACRELL